MPGRVVFDKIVQVLVFGVAYQKIADATCSATTIRRRRDEWNKAGIFEELVQICLESYDRVVGIDFEDLAADRCIVKAPCGGEVAGRSPVDRGKRATKRSLLVDGNGIPRCTRKWHQRTGTARPCYAPRWRVWHGSVSTCPRT